MYIHHNMYNRLYHHCVLRPSIRQYSNKSSFMQSVPWPTRPPIITTNKYSSFVELVGNTSLLRLNYISELTKCNIYGKCEWENPVCDIICCYNRTILFMDYIILILHILSWHVCIHIL